MQDESSPHRQWRIDLYRRGGKRLFDVSLTCLALPVAVPVLAVIALVVRVALGPGIWFCQERIGLHGQPFTVYKFRTMEADRRTAPVGTMRHDDRRLTHKTTADPRHTRLGRRLRSSGLDELPQLLNVLLGDMSLVGPRPELPHIVDGYAPWQHERHNVRPGITGLWQVNVRGLLPMHEAVETDIAYIQTITLRADLSIIAQTLPVLRRRTGA